MTGSSQKVILIIEDDSTLSNITKDKFESHGYRVLQASNGVEGLDLIEKKRPDIVLSEVILPKIDGFSLLDKVRRSKTISDIPIVLLTGLGQVNDVERGKSAGAVDYMIKSHISLDDVVARVEKILNIQ
jgi:DNA-binding response OmpR family regulator